VRRKFYELHIADQSAIASHTIALMAPLWTIEAEARGHAPSTRMKTRRDKSAPIIAELFALWEKELPKLSGKTKFVEAIRYAISRRGALNASSPTAG
jgi:transposase